MQVLDFTHVRIDEAEKLLGHRLNISDDLILRHYRNRGILPLEIAHNLSRTRKTGFGVVCHGADSSALLSPDLSERRYRRTDYWLQRQDRSQARRHHRQPRGALAGNGRTRRARANVQRHAHRPARFEYKLTFDKDGRKTSERIITPPVPGYNVVTTLDLHLQQVAEKALEAKAKRGAIVIMDPNSGDILAMASWPNYDPNVFIPKISSAKFKELQDDPNIPLLPRAFRSAYPPGSIFKVAVGIAALESGAIRPDDQFDCLSAIQIGNLTFHNWKKTERGELNFVASADRVVRHMVLSGRNQDRCGPDRRLGAKLGFGAKCGIPLRGEAEGRVPNDQYMKATHGRRLLNGDIANISIGQGDLLVTPLQMAQAMAIVANGGTFYQTRLVQQVQTVDNQIVTAYQVRAKKTLDPSRETM